MAMEPFGILHHLLKVVRATLMINSDTLNTQSGVLIFCQPMLGKGVRVLPPRGVG